MSQPLFATAEELKQFIAQAEPDQFEKVLKQFSIHELAESFSLLHTNDPHSKRKSIALFEHIASSDQLESLGEHLTMQEFLHVMDFLAQHPPYQNKLSFLLTGLPPQIFCAALNFYQTEHLALFKQEGVFEPLQYHLTQFVHEGESLGRHVVQHMEQFKINLSVINPPEVTREILDNLYAQIDTYRNDLLDFLERISVALSIAWNTDRIDLIEKLSTINEALQHQLVLFIGHPSSESLSSTGLYVEVENALAKAFDSTLNDGDAATEGLTRLGIWHLKDYWALGLLPQIQREEDLGLDPSQAKDIQFAARHQHLLSQAQKQLEHLKIVTVLDLKQKQLFSKALLKDYINEHRQPITYQ